MSLGGFGFGDEDNDDTGDDIETEVLNGDDTDGGRGLWGPLEGKG